MSVANVVVGVVVLGWLISRQVRDREIGEAQPYRAAAILTVIGVIETVQYAQHHPVAPVAVVVLVVGLALAAGFGYWRALTMRIWRRADGVLMRRGGAVTVVLWVVGVAVHLGGDLLLSRVAPGSDGLGSASLLAYLGISLAAQRWIVMDRARRLAVTTGSS